MIKNKPIFKLTEEELEIEAEFASGEVVSVAPSVEEREQIQAMARNTLAKNKMITIRLSERNLLKIKAAAAREGLPDQTFITSLLHKHVL
jgi:predicted DNA binding CopG/RHH family protein